MPRRWLLARLAAAAVLAIVLIIVLAVGVGVLAYGTGPTRTGELEVEGLISRVTVGWPDDGPPVIEAADEAGLWAGLGYAHAADKAWSMTLWRQVALGNLGAWFPERGTMDEHARLLGFATLARHTYDTLPADDRAALDAYALGVQAALRQPGVAERDEFVLVDVRPEPWQPWHALAVERLVAWLGAPAAISDTSFAAAAATDTQLASFVRADSAFRAYLAIGGFDHARAFAAPVAGAASFVVEQPFGSSAVPLFAEAVLRLDGRTLVAATVPGTLALHAGHSDTRAWSIFPTSDVRVEPFPGVPPPPDYDRLVDREGDETLLTIPRSTLGLFLTGAAARPAAGAPAPVRPDPDSVAVVAVDTFVVPPSATVWRVSWAGFGSGTDVPTWRALLAGEAPPDFALLRGDGLLFPRNGTASILGDPEVHRQLPGGVFVAATPAAAYAGERLAALLAAPPEGDSLVAYLDDTYSPWAAERLGPLVTALGDRRTLEPELRDPYAFLRGWDARYSTDAIGASLFDTWLAIHRNATGGLPPLRPDSADAELLRWSLRQTVRRLRAEHGTEPAAWRWERVQAGRLVFPVWSSGDASRAAERYAPVPAARGGHPTAVRGGPSPIFGGAPGVWTLWSTETAWDRPAVRSARVETQGFLSRARSVSREAEARVISLDLRAERVLTLVPAPRG